MPPTSSVPLSLTLLLVLALCTWFDVRERRLPNWVTLGGLVASLALRGVLGGAALGQGILGCALGLSLGFLLFAAGAIGAGDGKMLASVGAFLGLGSFLRSLPLIAALGGVLALIVTVRNGSTVATLARFRLLLFHVVSFGRIGAYRTLSTPGAATIPYGAAVAAGTAMAWLGWGPTL